MLIDLYWVARLGTDAVAGARIRAPVGVAAVGGDDLRAADDQPLLRREFRQRLVFVAADASAPAAAS